MAWYDEFFDEHYLDYWSQILPQERTSREVRFIVEQMGVPDGGAVLDLCCGQARHAVELAKLGYDVTGLDLNEFLLEAGREFSKTEGVSIRFVQGDMREIPFENQFEAVVNLFTAFGYFEDEAENQRALAGVCRALKPGGRFLIDQSHVLQAARDFQPRVWKEFSDGTVLAEERSFDAERVRYRTRAVFIKPDGRRAERCNDIRCYTCAELSAMLRRAGLEPVAVFGNFRGRPLELTSKRLIIISEKRGGT
jgi:ubiquinone/menaquinone biosynthesis C-methylase UbiE